MRVLAVKKQMATSGHHVVQRMARLNTLGHTEDLCTVHAKPQLNVILGLMTFIALEGNGRYPWLRFPCGFLAYEGILDQCSQRCIHIVIVIVITLL